MSAILKFDFKKKRTITFFWSKLSKLHKKDSILHVATTFSLKQGETRTSHGPIPHPLKEGMSDMQEWTEEVLEPNKTLFLCFSLGMFSVRKQFLH